VKIRLAVTLDIRREPAETPPDRETSLDSLVERSDDRPPIGFRPHPPMPEESK